MFKKINNAHAISGDGYEIKFNQSYISYIEKAMTGKKALHIEAEFMLASASLTVYKETINGWFPPHHEEIITQGEKDKICRRVREALTFLGVTFQMD